MKTRQLEKKFIDHSFVKANLLTQNLIVMFLKRILIPILFLVFSLNTFAQTEEHECEHHHSKFELGLSNGLVYNFTESEAAYGLHVHVVSSIGESDKFGMGIGYERIFDDHKHNALSLVLLYHPIEHVSINLAPGVTWLGSDSNTIKPALHLEGLYEFKIGKFHLGPLLGVAFNTEDLHASVGLHLAYGF